MNAPTGPLIVDPFEVATSAVNSWRGRCLSYFTRAEHIVTEALLTLAEADPALPLPLLVGQRYGALLAALSGRDDAAQAIEAITTFQRHDELRSFLCHGLAQVLLDRSGGWHVAFALLTLRRKKADRSQLLLDEAEATSLATDLRREQQRLEAKLRAVVSRT